MMTNDEIREFLRQPEHLRDREAFRKQMIADARAIIDRAVEPEYRETA